MIALSKYDLVSDEKKELSEIVEKKTVKKREKRTNGAFESNQKFSGACRRRNHYKLIYMI